MIQGEVVIEYLKKFPNTASKTLARKIYNENKNNLLFNNEESVRTLIRYYRGSIGNINRKYRYGKSI